MRTLQLILTVWYLKSPLLLSNLNFQWYYIIKHNKYKDLFIHRIISEYYVSNEKQRKRLAEKAPKYAKNSSEREKVAQKAEREAESMKNVKWWSITASLPQ